MSENPSILSNTVLWGSRLAVVGVVFAGLTVSVSVVGVNSVGRLYWAGILLAICGITGAAIRGAQYSTVRYAGGVLSAMVGVFVIGYGVENGNLPILLVGVVTLVVGALGVISDTQRTE